MHTISGMKTQPEQVIALLKKSSMMSSREFTLNGINRKTLTRMVQDGHIQRIGRGLYTSKDYIPGTYHSFIEASKLVNKSVICLLSALSYHNIGTQNPSEVWLAIPRRTRIPQLESYSYRISQFSEKAYISGIEKKVIDGVEISIYSIPKTIADCFKYRNKIGLDVAIEALKDTLQNKYATVEELFEFAEICRVKEIITPYMESIL